MDAMMIEHEIAGDGHGSTEAALVERPVSLESLVGLMRETTGLDEDQAKTIVYYAVVTYGINELDKIPVLTLYGPAGTGKTTLLDILGLLAHEPLPVDGKVSRPALRDVLLGADTVLVDEADTVYERWMENRYSRKAAQMHVKRERADGGWDQQVLSLFGATVLARRKPFRDPAILSRCVVVRTRHQKDGVGPFIAEDFYGQADSLRSVAADIPRASIQASQGSRLDDTWAPLRCVAARLGDEVWLNYATIEMEKAKTELRMGQGEEPTEAVFRAILALSLEDERPEGAVAERVPQGTVSRYVSENGEKLSSWQVGQLARQLGFEVKQKGGTQYVYTGGVERLKAIGRELGVNDEWLLEAS